MTGRGPGGERVVGWRVGGADGLWGAWMGGYGLGNCGCDFQNKHKAFGRKRKTFVPKYRTFATTHGAFTKKY